MSKSDHNQVNYVIISPARNEEHIIQSTIESVVSQTIKPLRWVIVDDGSTDGTADIISKYALQYSWIKLVNRKDRGFSYLGSGVVEAFYDGLSKIGEVDYDFLVKLDCDLEFDPSYFSHIFNKFIEMPTLGIASGQTYYRKGNDEIWEDAPVDHVRGASKIYRKKCFEQIGGIRRSVGWDTIDEVRARMMGWSTRSYPNLKILHLRPTGSKDGIIRGNIRHGKISYLIGSDPVYFFLRCLYRLFSEPLIIGSLALCWGYISNAIRHQSKIVDKEFERYYRREQRSKLLNYNFWKLYHLKIGGRSSRV